MNQDRKSESCECALSYELCDGKGNPASGGRAQALISAETLSLQNEAGPVRAIALRDIERIDTGNYSIEILLCGNEKLSLSRLGYYFEDFLRILHQNRNELTLIDMLAEEEVLIPGLDAEAEVCDSGGRAILQGKSGIRLYKTSLAILPLLGEIIRIPLAGSLGSDQTNSLE